VAIFETVIFTMIEIMIITTSISSMLKPERRRVILRL
jgi:hypothetical protein